MPAQSQSAPEGWTIAQAAFLLGEPLDAFKKAVERSPVKPRMVRRAGLKVRYFAFHDLVYLRAVDELRGWIGRESRPAFYEAMTRTRLEEIDVIAFGPMTVKVRPYVTYIQLKTRELGALAAKIDESGGDALIKGTTIEAHRIASLLDGGMTVDQVLADYPSLTEAQVLAAKAYADANPKPGRPYPGQTAKAALRNADLKRLGEFLDS
ncbi:DUF433 domain-containing protein [Phenylobacterium sp.]|uniref:DUF433 domain-containing protein n=1 Tax=Phenylobacterium sp. TaxID=1871053 RepID=UPI003D293FF5